MQILVICISFLALNHLSAKGVQSLLLPQVRNTLAFIEEIPKSLVNLSNSSMTLALRA